MDDIEKIIKNIEERQNNLHQSEDKLKKIQDAKKSGFATHGEIKALETAELNLSQQIKTEGERIIDTRSLVSKKQQLEGIMKVLERGYSEHEEYIGESSAKTIRKNLGFFDKRKLKSKLQEVEQNIKDLESKI
jgi:hypothetical protein